MYFYLTSVLILLGIGLTIEIIFREHLFHFLKGRIVWALVFLAVGTIWDTYAIPNGHWVFPGNGILGIHVGVIPLEEFLWFLIIPYFCLTVYKAAHIYFDKKGNTDNHMELLITILFLVVFSSSVSSSN